MNQEYKIIKVHLEKRQEKDYMVFDMDEEKAVCLNEENSQNELKSVFSVLLDELLKSQLKLEFVENNEYKVRLYIDVCNEYIKDLNKQITQVYKNIPEKFKLIQFS